MMQDIAQLRDRLHAAANRVQRKLSFMEVCGTHTVAGFRTGLHAMLPANVRLLSGPGCPVCVTAQGDIDLMVDVALEAKVTLFTYGDMLKVPGTRGNLELARSRGAKVKVLYSTLDAVKYAQANPAEQVCWARWGLRRRRRRRPLPFWRRRSLGWRTSASWPATRCCCRHCVHCSMAAK